jgi:MFS family permease
MIGGIAFSQFFLQTLYMQDVLGYSAIRTGVGFATVTFTIIVFSNVAQRLVTRLGVRTVLTAGLLLDSVSLGLFTQLPADGHYFWNLFPGMLVGGVGLALSFVPVTIAGLTGVHRADAGIASGLINTSRQVGGAVGLAAVSTIVTASATSGSGGAVDASLTNGFQTGFLVLSGIALLGAVIAGALLAPPPEGAAVELFNRDNPTPLEEAA